MRKHLVLPAALAATLFLGSCAAPQKGPAGKSVPATNTSEGHSTDDGHAHGAEEHYGVPAVTWDAAAETAVKDTAGKVMGLFARPDVPEAAWFSDLSPYLLAEYAEDARYIDPARVPVRKVPDGPAITREAGNPLTVTASFSTDAGRWQMILHRSGQEEPWLVTAISPQDPAETMTPHTADPVTSERNNR
jgi:hypothetical protein